ncbi:Hypothetical predicted protein [Pelobates cultripes]|uniref:Uncharacterized protein n=1 Tax=Pelobates cultripes TaxID=61616 RepID=A0AAD1RK20_PELCU|nr:Hypothetical predicted protein [Pelobates cultripes]
MATDLETSLSKHLSPLFPLTHNPHFQPGMACATFHTLHDSPYLTLSRLINNKGIKPLTDIIPDAEPTNMQRFNYSQLIHFLFTHPMLMKGSRDETQFEIMCQTRKTKIRLLSTMYKTLQRDTSTPRPLYITSWENDLQLKITDTECTQIFTNVFHSSISNTSYESNHKRISRWHYTPSRIQHLFPTTSNDCWRCNQPNGTAGHIWWSCPIIQKYWQTILAMIATIVTINLPMDPKVTIFLLLPVHLPKLQKCLISHLLTVANTLIPLYWKKSDVPSVREWVQKTESIRLMNEINLSLTNLYARYIQTWEPWLKFMQTPSRT